MKTKPLLKEMPGFSESIENNLGLIYEISSLLEDIEIENNYDSIEDDCVSDIVESLSFAKFKIDENGYVKIEDKQSLAIHIFKELRPLLEEQEDFIIMNKRGLVDLILKEIKGFIDENYTQK